MDIKNYLSLVLIISAAILVYIGHYSWKRNKKYVSITLLPAAIYAFGYAFEILCTNIEAAKFWIKVEYLGISFINIVWLLFALNFTGYIDRINKNVLRLLFIIPMITLI